MLDATREIQKYRPLPVNPADVTPVGATAAAWQEVSKSLHDLGMAQFRSAADVKVLVARMQELTEIQAQRAAELPEEAERSLLLSFLPVVDTFDLAFDAVLLLGQPTWREQFEQFRSTMTQLLEQMGLNHVAGVGSPFDPEVHDEAAAFSHTDEEYAHFQPGTVAAVYQRGFFWKGRLLRKGQVIVVR